MSDELKDLTDEELAAAIEETEEKSHNLTTKRSELLAEAAANQERQDELKAEHLRRNPPNPTGAIGA